MSSWFGNVKARSPVTNFQCSVLSSGGLQLRRCAMHCLDHIARRVIRRRAGFECSFEFIQTLFVPLHAERQCRRSFR